MLKGLLRWGGYAALFCAVSTVGQSIGFSNGINAGAVSQTVGSLLGKLPGTDMSKGGVIAAIPGAEQKTFAKTSQLIR